MLGFLKLAEAVKPVLCFHSPESYHCWGQSPVKQSNPDSQARRRPPTESNALTYEESTTAHQQVPMYAFWDMSSPDKSLQFRNTFKGDVFQVFGHFAVEPRTLQSSLNFLRKGGSQEQQEQARPLQFPPPPPQSWVEGESAELVLRCVRMPPLPGKL